MNEGGKILKDTQQLLEMFEQRCSDGSTLGELRTLLSDRERWEGAHELFQRIRQKTLVAERTKNELSCYQYAFEECCAKTIYNLGMFPGPFDPDSPYWIVPRALALAELLGVEKEEVLSIVRI